MERAMLYWNHFSLFSCNYCKLYPNIIFYSFSSVDYFYVIFLNSNWSISWKVHGKSFYLRSRHQGCHFNHYVQAKLHLPFFFFALLILKADDVRVKEGRLWTVPFYEKGCFGDITIIFSESAWSHYFTKFILQRTINGLHVDNAIVLISTFHFTSEPHCVYLIGFFFYKLLLL